MTFSPIIPHLTNECLIDIGYKEKLNWPIINEAYLKDKNIDYVVQINGKKRGLKHYIVEQEAYQDSTPMEAARDNVTYMRNLKV